MIDPFAFLEGVTDAERAAFEMGLVYADMCAAGKGPWIMRDRPQKILHDMARQFHLRLVIDPYTELGETPWPMIEVKAYVMAPDLRLV
uniref:Uncharacterized protein n=1 Tax=Pseudomonas phage HRDY3 TaxID=3236930 RepID=A0AB39CDI6_9VIRU